MESDNIEDLAKRLGQAVRKIAHPPFHKPRPFGWIEGQFAISHLIMDSDNQGVSPGYLAEKLQVGSGRIGNALKKMEAKGIIERKPDPKDKRKTIVKLSKKGYGEALAHQQKHLEDFKEMADKVGVAKIETLISILDDIAASGFKLGPKSKDGKDEDERKGN